MNQTDIISKVKVLLDKWKHSANEISKLVGVSRRTVYAIIRRIENGESLGHSKGGGRLPTKRESIKYSAAQYIMNDPTKPVREISSEISSKHKLSVSTVHRCFPESEVLEFRYLWDELYAFIIIFLSMLAYNKLFIYQTCLYTR